MSIKITKDIAVNSISSTYGINLNTSTISAELVFDIDSITIYNDNSCQITVSLKVNGLLTSYTKQLAMTYDLSGKDVYTQAWAYLNSNVDKL